MNLVESFRHSMSVHAGRWCTCMYDVRNVHWNVCWTMKCTNNPRHSSYSRIDVLVILNGTTSCRVCIVHLFATNTTKACPLSCAAESLLWEQSLTWCTFGHETFMRCHPHITFKSDRAEWITVKNSYALLDFDASVTTFKTNKGHITLTIPYWCIPLLPC